MPQYWLKPLGVTDPPTPMPNDWTTDRSLDRFDLRTGPAIPQKIPQMGRGDRVLFHAVIHVRLFAEGEILWRPEWKEDPVWGLRWPWVYPCRIDVWVPLIEQGLASSEVVPKRALGRIQAGGDFAKLSAEEYSGLLNALRAQPSARQRPHSTGPLTQPP